MFKAGLHVPVILFNDIAGNGVKAAPGHIGATGLKVGVTAGLTVMVKFVVAAHCPVDGVKV